MKVIIIFVLSILFSLATVGACQINWESAVVTSVLGDEVEVETTDGNLFRFQSGDEFKPGDKIAVEFDGRGTANRTDDRIIAIERRP